MNYQIFQGFRAPFPGIQIAPDRFGAIKKRYECYVIDGVYYLHKKTYKRLLRARDLSPLLSKIRVRRRFDFDMGFSFAKFDPIFRKL